VGRAAWLAVRLRRRRPPGLQNRGRRTSPRGRIGAPRAAYAGDGPADPPRAGKPSYPCVLLRAPTRGTVGLLSHYWQDGGGAAWSQIPGAARPDWWPRQDNDALSAAVAAKPGYFTSRTKLRQSGAVAL